MELLYYRDLIGNFGDDLNESIWQKLLPAHVFEAVDTVLMGIGSIFNERSAPLSLDPRQEGICDRLRRGVRSTPFRVGQAGIY